MADHEEDDLQMALRMSLMPPEAKRSKPREIAEESIEARNRRLQRELMASAAEKRLRAATATAADAGNKTESAKPVSAREDVGSKAVPVVRVANEQASVPSADKLGRREGRELVSGEELSSADAEQLFLMVFGNCVSKDVLAQWSNQGIRLSHLIILLALLFVLTS